MANETKYKRCFLSFLLKTVYHIIDPLPIIFGENTMTPPPSTHPDFDPMCVYGQNHFCILKILIICDWFCCRWAHLRSMTIHLSNWQTKFFLKIKKNCKNKILTIEREENVINIFRSCNSSNWSDSQKPKIIFRLFCYQFYCLEKNYFFDIEI